MLFRHESNDILLFSRASPLFIHHPKGQIQAYAGPSV